MKPKFAYTIAVLLLVAVLGGAIGLKLYERAAIREYLDNREVPAVYLHAAVAREEIWDQRLSAIGSLVARQGIEIRSEVDGVIRQVHAKPRDLVRAGELLVEMDDTVDQATLKSARVRLDKTSRDFERDRKLFERALISEDQFESSRSDFNSAQALVEQTQGIIDRLSIHAPFTGSVGIHNLAEGHYLGKGDSVLTLQSLDTLYLDFNLPEKELERVKPGQRVIFTVPSHGERQFQAEVLYIDVEVQATTRNILVRAVVNNPGLELLPGMFADATVILDESQAVVTVPRAAVAFSLYGETVFLLTPDEGSKSGGPDYRAHRQSVTTGDVRSNRIVVYGLVAGQVVALDAQHRLLEGSPVVIANSGEPDFTDSGLK